MAVPRLAIVSDTTFSDTVGWLSIREDTDSSWRSTPSAE